MNKVLKAALFAMLVSVIQGCANGSGPAAVQDTGMTNSNATGQNMDYMYRSPSYQISHM